MRPLLKLCSLLSLPSLALLVGGCGSSGSNRVGTNAQTITFDNPGTQTAGTSLMLSAQASSDAVVTLTSATPGVCTVSGTTATFATPGTCTIDASQPGDSTYAAASQVAQSFTVNPAIGPTTTVYIAGYAFPPAPSPAFDVAEVWQLTSGNPTGAATALPMPSGMTSSQAYAIAVSGSDMYVAGYAGNSTGRVAVLWVNGVATILPSSMTSSEAGAIAVSGGNVYVTGAAWNSADSGTAVLWVNGTATTLAPPSGKAYAQAGAIAVSGNDVYVTGIAWNTDSDESAVLWVNGAVTLLPAPSGLTGDYWASGIAVSGGNVYMSGTTSPDVGNDTAISWVNGGTATTLLIPSNDTTQSYGALATAVLGNDVYVVGSGVSGATGNTTAAYWLNGKATTLPLPTNTTASPGVSYADGIGFSGSDVYMVGSSGQSAAYWVNGGAGTLLPMPSGMAYSNVGAIAVATQ